MSPLTHEHFWFYIFNVKEKSSNVKTFQQGYFDKRPCANIEIGHLIFVRNHFPPNSCDLPWLQPPPPHTRGLATLWGAPTELRIDYSHTHGDVLAMESDEKNLKNHAPKGKQLPNKVANVHDWPNQGTDTERTLALNRLLNRAQKTVWQVIVWFFSRKKCR